MPPPTLNRRVKWVLAAIIAVLVVIVILQNTEQVETRILFTSVTMPRAVLLIGTAAGGFLIGLLVGRSWWR